jgi:mannitol-1-phosphate/altronate dehydrogenase
MVEKLGKTLEGKATVITCMVDRICPGRDVEKDQIYVTTEPHLVSCYSYNIYTNACCTTFTEVQQ